MSISSLSSSLMKAHCPQGQAAKGFVLDVAHEALKTFEGKTVIYGTFDGRDVAYIKGLMITKGGNSFIRLSNSGCIMKVCLGLTDGNIHGHYTTKSSIALAQAHALEGMEAFIYPNHTDAINREVALLQAFNRLEAHLVIPGSQVLAESLGASKVDKHYIIMQKAPGIELLTLMIAAMPSGESWFWEIPVLGTLKLMGLLFKGLQDFHDKGYMHLDLDPSNIYFKPETGEVTLIDLLSVHTRTDSLSHIDFKYARNKEDYAAPELSRFKASAKTDVFSLGVIFTQLLVSDSQLKIDPIHTGVFNFLALQMQEPNETHRPTLALAKTHFDTYCRPYQQAIDAFDLAATLPEGLRSKP